MLKITAIWHDNSEAFEFSWNLIILYFPGEQSENRWASSAWAAEWSRFEQERRNRNRWILPGNFFKNIFMFHRNIIKYCWKGPPWSISEWPFKNDIFDFSLYLSSKSNNKGLEHRYWNVFHRKHPPYAVNYSTQFCIPISKMMGREMMMNFFVVEHVPMCLIGECVIHL